MNRTQRRAQMRANKKANVRPSAQDVKIQIVLNAATKCVALQFNRHLNNLTFSVEAARAYGKALLGAADKLEGVEVALLTEPPISA